MLKNKTQQKQTKMKSYSHNDKITLAIQPKNELINSIFILKGPIISVFIHHPGDGSNFEETA